METEEKMISQEKGWSQRRSGKGGGAEKTSCRRKRRKIVSERQRLVIERHT